MTDLEPTAFVQIEKLIDNRTDTEFADGYAWNTDELTRYAYDRAKEKHAVDFEQADYLVDFYKDENEQVDTFPMAELGYLSLKAHGS